MWTKVHKWTLFNSCKLVVKRNWGMSKNLYITCIHILKIHKLMVKQISQLYYLASLFVFRTWSIGDHNHFVAIFNLHQARVKLSVCPLHVHHTEAKFLPSYLESSVNIEIKFVSNIYSSAYIHEKISSISSPSNLPISS